MKIISLLLLCLFILTVPAYAAAPESAYDRILRTGTLRCGFATWPPYLVKNPNTGALSGPNYDYIEKMGQILSLKIEWTEEVGWGEYIQSLNNRRFDVMCSSDWAVGARLKYAGMTQAIFYSPLYAWVKTGNAKFDGHLQALDDPKVRLAVIDGDTSQNVAQFNFPRARFDALPQEAEGAQLLLEVSTGKADATIVDENIAEEFLAHNQGAIRRVAGAGAVQILPEVLVFKKDERDVKDMLDGAIALINGTDYPRQLVRKYKMDEFVPAFPYEPAAKTPAR